MVTRPTKHKMSRREAQRNRIINRVAEVLADAVDEELIGEELAQVLMIRIQAKCIPPTDGGVHVPPVGDKP